MKRIWFFILCMVLFGFANVSALTVSVHVPEKYQDVQGGDRLYFELTLRYPENPTRVDLKLEYQVVDSNGELVTQAKGLKAVETQASFLEFIVLPEEMSLGQHTIVIDIKDYGELSQRVETGFSVSRNRVDTLYVLIYALIGAVSFLAILVVVVFFRGKRL